MKKFGFAAIVASGLTAGLLGVVSPIQATALADAPPVISLPGYSTGIDRQQSVDTIHPPVTALQVDMVVRQSR